MDRQTDRFERTNITMEGRTDAEYARVMMTTMMVPVAVVVRAAFMLSVLLIVVLTLISMKLVLIGSLVR